MVRELSETRDTVRKRFRDSNDGEHPRKRYSGSSKDQKRRRPLRCFSYGKDGHLQRFCTAKEPSTSTSKPSVATCIFCAKSGHKVNTCFIKKGIEKRKNLMVLSTGKPRTPCKIVVDGMEMTGGGGYFINSSKTYW